MMIVESYVLFSSRSVISELHRQDVIMQFYSGYPMISKKNMFARSCAYIPSLDKAIEDTTGKCLACKLLKALCNVNHSSNSSVLDPEIYSVYFSMV